MKMQHSWTLLQSNGGGGAQAVLDVVFEHDILHPAYQNFNHSSILNHMIVFEVQELSCWALMKYIHYRSSAFDTSETLQSPSLHMI